MHLSRLALRSVELRNRLGLAPMSLYCADQHRPTQWHLVHYATRSQMPGLTIVEATAVSHQGAVTPGDLGLWCDEAIPAFRDLAQAIESAGSVPALQLSHGGRKASRTSPMQGDVRLSGAEGGWEIVGPSAIPFATGYDTPTELSTDGIRHIVADYRAAAHRARLAGFRMIELHAGHGRLLHSFYSPVANHRTDDYGGSFENRIRLLLEVVSAVRSEWPADLPLAVRLSCVDWLEEGWQLEDSVAVAAELRLAGVDLVDCTSGGIIRPLRVPAEPGYQVGFAREIKQKTGILTAAVGLLDSVDAINEVVESGSADIALVGRRMLLDPYLLAEDPRACDLLPAQYQRGVRSMAVIGTEHIPEL